MSDEGFEVGRNITVYKEIVMFAEQVLQVSLLDKVPW